MRAVRMVTSILSRAGAAEDYPEAVREAAEARHAGMDDPRRLAAYTAMDHAVRFAERLGVGAVSIRNTSHFGPADTHAGPGGRARHDRARCRELGRVHAAP
jgi:hypothetical protein